MKVPSDLCGGSCKGKTSNCPFPFVCGIAPANIENERKVLRNLLALIIIAGLVIFFLGLMVWP